MEFVFWVIAYILGINYWHSDGFVVVSLILLVRLFLLEISLEHKTNDVKCFKCGGNMITSPGFDKICCEDCGHCLR